MGIFSKDSRDHHKDGSYTDRHEDTKESLTYNEDGTLREYSYSDSLLPGGIFDSNIQVTKDGEDNTINVQWRDD